MFVNHEKNLFTVTNRNDSVHIDNCTYVQPENSWSDIQEICKVISAWNENGQADDDDYSLLSVKNYLQ